MGDPGATPGLLDRIRTVGLGADGQPAPTPWVADRPRFTLAGVAERALAGEPWDTALREFLDEFRFRPPHLRADGIADEPRLTGDPHVDAYLGAVGEWLAEIHDLDRPAWTTRPERFLDRFWFVSPVAGFRAQALAEAPAAFRRRGVLVPERSLRPV